MNVAAPPLDFLSAETLADPFAVYQSALAQGPVHVIPGTGITQPIG